MSHQPSDFPSPYKRLNLDLHSKPPPFDAKDKFHDLQHTVRKRLNDPQVLKYVHEIACSLVATSFYFKTSRVKAHRDGGYTVTGHVRCKFDEASANLRALGKFLVKQRSSQFTPYFFVQEPSRCKPTKGVKVRMPI